MFDGLHFVASFVLDARSEVDTIQAEIRKIRREIFLGDEAAAREQIDVIRKSANSYVRVIEG
jgi:hypothetical protein